MKQNLSRLFLVMVTLALAGAAFAATQTSAIQGYWLVGSDGGIFAFGKAHFYGSTGGVHLANPVVGMAATPDGGGYWLVASDGSIFAFGNAHFHGSTGGVQLAHPIVGMAATPDGGGYWLVASDGGVFAFNARFYGGTGRVPLAHPIVGMAATPNGRGYWLAGSDGSIFPFGNARSHGSTGGIQLANPIVGLAATPDGRGYWLADSAGGVVNFGTASLDGSLLGTVLALPIVGFSPAVTATVIPSSDVTTTTSGLVYDAQTKTYTQSVTVTNIGSGAIDGPISIAFTSLPAGVALADFTGYYNGSPYITARNTSLGPGQAAAVKAVFSDPSNGAITFSPVVLTGL